MKDSFSEQENYNELKFAKEQDFFEKSRAIKFLIGGTFIFCLFAFLHFRQIRVEFLEVGSNAPSYVVAQVDFDYFDEKATIILRQDSVRDIGKVYELSEKEIRQRRSDFENYLITNEEGRKNIDQPSFEQLYKGGEVVEKVLLQERFSDHRTLQKMEDFTLSTKNYFLYSPADISKSEKLPAQFWDRVRAKAMENKGLDAETVNFVVRYFDNQTWKFEVDPVAELNARRKIQSLIPEKYSPVSAGSRIIDQGEKVTAQHLAQMQAMKTALGKENNLWRPMAMLGSLILTLLAFGISTAYFHYTQPQILASNRKLLLITTIILLTLGLAKATELFLIYSKTNWIETVRYPLFVPFAAILLCSLINANVAIFASGFLTILLAVTLAFERQGFMVMNIAVAFVTILSAQNLKKRKEILLVCAKGWLCAFAVIISFQLYQGDFLRASFFGDIITSAVFMFLTAVLVMGLLPLLESSFRIMTDVTLMEFMDPNNDLLRRLTIEAPGTYQHSVVVGNLAEAAALAIGANGLFCRVSTLYHDIGKIKTPQYFTENQNGCMNIHQLLTPVESAHVILAHVTEGVEMALKSGLPEQFIDIIKEHHGTTLVYYFYRKQIERMKRDPDQVDELEFRYEGPKPRSKESAIIMIADSLEAASRSLPIIDEESVEELVSRLVRDKTEDGQFDNCLLTLEELAIVKATFVKTLVAFGHSRIKYPSRQSLGEEKEPCLN